LQAGDDQEIPCRHFKSLSENVVRSIPKFPLVITAVFFLAVLWAAAKWEVAAKWHVPQCAWNSDNISNEQWAWISDDVSDPPAPPGTKLSTEELHEVLSAAGEHHLDADLLASMVAVEGVGDAHSITERAAHLDSLLTRYHDNLAVALAAYHDGPAEVDEYDGVPPYPETRVFVTRVIHERNRRWRARAAQNQQANDSIPALPVH
jgi:hypothetical protein